MLEKVREQMGVLCPAASVHAEAVGAELLGANLE